MTNRPARLHRTSDTPMAVAAVRALRLAVAERTRPVAIHAVMSLRRRSPQQALRQPPRPHQHTPGQHKTHPQPPPLAPPRRPRPRHTHEHSTSDNETHCNTDPRAQGSHKPTNSPAHTSTPAAATQHTPHRNGSPPPPLPRAPAASTARAPPMRPLRHRLECGRSRDTAKRSDLAGWAQYGYCRSR